MNEELHMDNEIYLSNLTPSLIYRSVESEAKRIAKKVMKLKELIDRVSASLRNRFKEGIAPPYIAPIPTSLPKKLCVLAIDTSYTSPPIELTGGRLGVIYRVAVQFGSCRPKVVDYSALVKFIDEGERVVSLMSKVIERKFIYDTLKESSEPSIYDLIIIDGELLPRVPPGVLIGRSRSITTKYYNEIISLTNKILEIANKYDLPIVGVLKRIYGKDIQVLLNEPKLNITDKALASYVLRSNEYINLGVYSDIVRAYEVFLRSHEEMRERLEQRYRWLRNVVNHLPLSSAINVALYKPRTKTYFSIPTKVEIMLSNEYTLDEMVGYLASITSVNGVPFPIDIADTLSRVKREALVVAQQSLYSLLSKLLSDSKLALSIVGLTNPEKMSSIGFKG